MPTLTFSVDSKLLRELGERLVGKRFIALAELIKNSYDADATKVEIEFRKERGGTIVVRDDGCGMTFREFRDYWMRVGSTHKEEWMHSPVFKRPLTGIKGVGRLAVQLLAGEIEVCTASEKKRGQQLRAFLRWKDAISAGELTKARVDYEMEKGDFEHGTTIKLWDLTEKWTSRDFRGLATELWRLVPPFRGFQSIEGPFEIDFKSYNKEAAKGFEDTMTAFLRNYETKISGKNTSGRVRAVLEYYGEDPKSFEYNLKDLPPLEGLPKRKSLLDGEFEIRIYRLLGRQRFGLLVNDAREYMHMHGGVHIYDSGFHLPFYGDQRNDWLGILSEHARRMTQESELLPQDLQVPRGLTFLPSLSRVLGVVKINTGLEPNLHIAITRDRLLETEAYLALREMIRYALHWYAMEEKRRKVRKDYSETKVPPRPSREEFEKIEDVLERYKPDISEGTYDDLQEGIYEVLEEKEKEARDRFSLMGAFATAGVNSLAYQHEIEKQLGSVKYIADEIDRLAEKNGSLRDELTEIGDDLMAWYRRARSLNSLFSYFSDEGSFSIRKRFNAKKVVGNVEEQIQGLIGECDIDTEKLSKDLLLPEASMAEWVSVLQNVLINAYNAMADSAVKKIGISNGKSDGRTEILIQDTGSGVNLEKAEKLFEPFVREVDIPPEKRALGYGGTGIGLTIVRIISNRIGCSVSFVKPTKGYNTAFSLSWEE